MMMAVAMGWARGHHVIRTALFLLLMLASCALHGQVINAGSPPSPQEIVYASADLGRISVFAPDGFRYGPPLDYRPDHPPAAIRYFEPEVGVQCVSMGVPGNTTEYAIKRPIRMGERYQCGRTSFRVIRCFADCRAAVIEHDTRFAENLGEPEGYIYVNDCLGILAFSWRGFTDGIPLDAELLRGNVGILANPNYPNCFNRP
jgi:hypothetical protein